MSIDSDKKETFSKSNLFCSGQSLPFFLTIKQIDLLSILLVWHDEVSLDIIQIKIPSASQSFRQDHNYFVIVTFFFFFFTFFFRCLKIHHPQKNTSPPHAMDQLGNMISYSFSLLNFYHCRKVKPKIWSWKKPAQNWNQLNHWNHWNQLQCVVRKI